MRNLLLVAGLTLISGCTTLGNLSKINRYMPLVDNLIYLQDNADKTQRPVSIQVCDKEPGQVEELERLPRLMGWTRIGLPVPKDGQLCVPYEYTPKP